MYIISPFSVKEWATLEISVFHKKNGVWAVYVRRLNREYEVKEVGISSELQI